MLSLLAAAQSTLGSVWWPEVDGFCKDGICFPSVCSAGKLESRWNLTDGSVPSWLRYQPPAYDYVGTCPMEGLERFVETFNPACGDACPPSPPQTPVDLPPVRVGCGDHPENHDAYMRTLALYVVVVLYMFYGLAHVCEDFLVPALNVLCERKGIPEDVAGATLMAAGCNAPELFASVIGVFIQHSTVGAGTVVGSAPFNVLCICGAAAFAVGGNLVVDGWLMLREISMLALALVLFLVVLADNTVIWWEAALLCLFYVAYALVVVKYQALLAYFARRFGGAPAPPRPLEAVVTASTTLDGTPGLADSASAVDLLRAARSRAASNASGIIQASLSRALLDAGAAAVDVDVPSAATAAAAAAAAASAGGGGGGVATTAPLNSGGAAPRAGEGPRARLMAVDESRAESFSALVGECRERSRQYRLERPVTGGFFEAAEGFEAGGVRIEGVLFKKSRFYSRVRMGKHIWQKRYFVLDADARHPLRYYRMDDGGAPDTTRSVAIALGDVTRIVRVSDAELQLVGPRQTATLRVNPATDGGASTIARWFDELIVRIDELRADEESAAAAAAAAEESAPAGRKTELLDEFEVEHEAWYRPPASLCGRALFAALLPLKAPIHLTIPDVLMPRWADYYVLTLVLATAWLSILAFLMNLALERIGCALGVSETVMGLTLGAVGTSFPNLYASVLTARAGQAGMSLSQAFGSNTFNICICLGLVWLVQAAAGTCFFGALSLAGWCEGCYMPMGLESACPNADGAPPVAKAGSLAGATLVVYASMALFIGAAAVSGGKINNTAAALFFAVYLLYIAYEVGAAYELVAPVCLGPICL